MALVRCLRLSKATTHNVQRISIRWKKIKKASQCEAFSIKNKDYNLQPKRNDGLIPGANSNFVIESPSSGEILAIAIP
jgi:hypothetical protein